MKINKYISNKNSKRVLILCLIIAVTIIGIFSRNFFMDYNYKEIKSKSNKEIYISDFCKDSSVDKCVLNLNNKLKNNYNKQEILDILLKYYKDSIDEYFGEGSGNSCYNKVNNTINVSVKSSNISKEAIMQSDYELQNEWNLIISKMANFTRKTKGIINELANYDVNIQVDIVDKDTNEVMATIRNGEISYSIT